VRRLARAVLTGVALFGTALALAACVAKSPGPSDRHPRDASPGQLATSRAPANVVQPQPMSGSCHARGVGLYSLPDPRCTPGAIDRAVSQKILGTTICRDAFTASERPPESVSEPEKRASLAAYGDTGPLPDYEYDHLIPLELGGAANDLRNLWPEPGASPNPKDTLDSWLNELACQGRMGPGAAQRLIARDWVSPTAASGKTALTRAPGRRSAEMKAWLPLRRTECDQHDPG